MRLRRRALLASVAGGLASVTGCLSNQGIGAADDADGRYTITDFSVATETVAPTHEYVLDIVRVYSTDAVDRHYDDPRVIDVAEIENGAIRDAVKRALRDAPVKTDSVPDGLDGFVDRYDFFTWAATTDASDTATHWGLDLYHLHPDRPPAVEFDATLSDPEIGDSDPGVITFSLGNTGTRIEKVFSGTVPPFSILWAERVDDDGRFLLWRNYTEEGCVTFSDRGLVQCDVGKETSIAPGTAVEKPYEIRLDPRQTPGDGIEPGEYRVADTLSYHHGGEPSTEVEWTVEFAIEE